MIVYLNNNIYDITTFIDEHPGGNDVFILNTDITNKFNEIGHSSYAVSLLENYNIGKLTPDSIFYNSESNLKYNTTKISKLFTHEDKFNIHKIFGIICLLNYIYLFIDFIFTGFIGTISLRSINIYFIILSWVHALLSISSMQFLIPKSRTGILPMIWQEFRIHSILFAMRSILCLNIEYLTMRYLMSI